MLRAETVQQGQQLGKIDYYKAVPYKKTVAHGDLEI